MCFSQERDVLSETVTRVRGECQDLKLYVENLEARHNNAERVVLALRDALKDERSARTRAESQCNGFSKVRNGDETTLDVGVSYNFRSFFKIIHSYFFTKLHSSFRNRASMRLLD